MKKKLLALILSVAVVASIAAAGTLAYLTAQTDDVVNTFTVGNIQIDLKEHVVDNEGNLTEEATIEQIYSRVLPGEVINKDPFVTVEEGSEDCYVYVCVDNKLNTIEIPSGVVATMLDVDTSKWVAVSDPTANKVVYRLGDLAVSAYDGAVTEYVFKHVIFNDELTNDDMLAIQAAAGSNTITIQAFAHQAENLNRAEIDAIACDTSAFELPAPNLDNIW